MAKNDDRVTGGRFLAKMAIALLLVAAAQLMVFRVAGSPGIPPEILAFDGHLDDGVDVVYFGDSAVMEFVPGDTDERGLADMLADALPSKRVLTLAHFAYPPEVFAAYSKVLADAKNAPDTVVLPINLRCFSPSWYRKPEWQFEKEKFLLRNHHDFARAALRPLAVFGYLDLAPVSQAEYEATPVYLDGEATGTVGDYEKRLPTIGDDSSYSAHFMYEYGYSLTEDHPQLVALADAVRQLRAAGIETVCYVTPIDFEHGERVAGAEFAAVVQRNVETIERVLGRADSTPHDWSRRMDSAAFGYEDRIHEHLNETARAELVGSLVDILSGPSRTETP